MFITLWKFYLFARFSFTFITATDIPPTVENQHGSCFSNGALVGLVIGCTMAAVLVTVAVCLLVWYYVRKRKRASETRTSLKNVSFLAYDNSQFRSDEPLGTGVPPTSVVTVNEHGGKFYAEEPKQQHIETLQTETLENQMDNIVRVPMQSNRYSGLGFTIAGNFLKGMFVRSISNCSPAKECGQLDIGDRILSVKINFENVTYEDAMTILDYASGYPLIFEVEKCARFCKEDLSHMNHTPTTSDSSTKFNPLFKSLSIDDTSSVGLDHFLNHSRLINLKNVNKQIQCSSQLKNEFTERESCTTTKASDETTLKFCDHPHEMVAETDSGAEYHTQSTIRTSDSHTSFVALPVHQSNQSFASEPSEQVCTSAIFTDDSEPEETMILAKVDGSNLLEADNNNWKTHICIDDTTDNPDICPQGIDYPITKFHNIKLAPLKDDSLFRSRSVECLNEPHNHSDSLITSYSMTNMVNGISGFEDNEFIDYSKRDSGYGTIEQTDEVVEIEKEQFEKLLYFQSQLAKQHEELARLGINVPMPAIMPLRQNL